jgi:hypothetical protein
MGSIISPRPIDSASSVMIIPSGQTKPDPPFIGQTPLSPPPSIDDSTAVVVPLLISAISSHEARPTRTIDHAKYTKFRTDPLVGGDAGCPEGVLWLPPGKSRPRLALKRETYERLDRVAVVADSSTSQLFPISCLWCPSGEPGARAAPNPASDYQMQTTLFGPHIVFSKK